MTAFPKYDGFAASASGVAQPDEETVLKSQLSMLEEQLVAVKTRLDEIEESKK